MAENRMSLFKNIQKDEIAAKQMSILKFEKGNFREIVNISEMCLLTNPCKHYVTYIDYEGVKKTICMTLTKIKKICEEHNIQLKYPHL